MSDEWLTATEAAAHLKVNRRTLYRWCEQGRLRYYDLETGGGRRFKREDLDALLRERRPERVSDELVVGADGIVLLPEDIERRRRTGDPSSVGGGPEEHEAGLLQIEIERSQDRMRGIEKRIKDLEEDLMARGPSEFVQGDLNEAQHRLEQLRRHVTAMRAEYERRTGRTPGG